MSEHGRGRLRIAIVAPPWFEVPPQAYGGTESVCAGLADRLVARGHQVTLVGAGRDRTAADFQPPGANRRATAWGSRSPRCCTLRRPGGCCRTWTSTWCTTIPWAGTRRLAGRRGGRHRQAGAAGPRRLACLLFPVCWAEPFGLVMIEALACGTPVVALARGSVPEVLVDGVTGFVCQDPGELPDAIGRVPELDPGRLRQDARRRFDLSAMVAGYEQVYRRLLAQLGALRLARPAS